MVVVCFTSGHGVEVVPAFALDSGQYVICDTHDNGSYKTIDPRAEIAAIQMSDAAMEGTTRDLVKMIKQWQQACNARGLLKSFQIELLVMKFLPTLSYGHSTRSLYDWLIRDFFGFLVQQSGSYVTNPGTGEFVLLGDSWVSRAQSAYELAVTASDFEERELPMYAVDRWQRIFGTDIT